MVPYEGGTAPPPETGKGKSKGKGKAKKPTKEASVDHVKNMSEKAAYKVIRGTPARFGARSRGADGNPRCRNFQVGSCTTVGCKFTHGCLRCGGPHGITRCPELGMDKR